MRVVLPSEMARIDRMAVEEEGIPSLELMERAGEGVARAARDMLSCGAGRRVAVVCGKGNNGGDGLVAARRLSASFEASVCVVGATRPDCLSPDSRANFERLPGTPVVVQWLSDPGEVAEFARAAPTFDLIIDCLFGTGFKGPASGVFAGVIDAVNASGRPVLAVDIPSGVEGDTGAVAGPAVVAEKTVTFAAPKVGLVQFPGAGHVGEMDVVDIGIPDRLVENVPDSRIFVTTEEEADGLLPHRPPDAHKGTCGNVLVIGGSAGMSGAVSLCAQAALRSGAGLVRAAVPEGLCDIMETKLTEVITVPVAQGRRRSLSLEAADVLMECGRNASAVALGPGMSTEPEARDLARRLVAGIEAPLVLDADGLNAMAGSTDALTKRRHPLVLTPHPGEMARLLGTDTEAVQRDRIGAARRAAADWEAVVVLKGAGTVTAGPDGDVYVNPTGNSGMATAGMGDVLTGCVASMLAQGLGVLEAAVAAAWFHGYAGDLAARMEGRVGMTAGDVARHLPLALRRVPEERWS